MRNPAKPVFRPPEKPLDARSAETGKNPSASTRAAGEDERPACWTRVKPGEQSGEIGTPISAAAAACPAPLGGGKPATVVIPWVSGASSGSPCRSVAGECQKDGREGREVLVWIPNPVQNSPLIEAAEKGDLETVKAIIDSGTDVISIVHVEGIQVAKPNALNMQWRWPKSHNFLAKVLFRRYPSFVLGTAKNPLKIENQQILTSRIVVRWPNAQSDPLEAGKFICFEKVDPLLANGTFFGI